MKCEGSCNVDDILITGDDNDVTLKFTSCKATTLIKGSNNRLNLHGNVTSDLIAHDHNHLSLQLSGSISVDKRLAHYGTCNASLMNLTIISRQSSLLLDNNADIQCMNVYACNIGTNKIVGNIIQ
jgi:hypothetical protein